jgi:hypothetical protein
MQHEKIILLPTTHESLPSFNVQRELLSSFLDHLAKSGIKVVEPPEAQRRIEAGSGLCGWSGCAGGYPNRQAPGGARRILKDTPVAGVHLGKLIHRNSLRV